MMNLPTMLPGAAVRCCRILFAWLGNRRPPGPAARRRRGHPARRRRGQSPLRQHAGIHRYRTLCRLQEQRRNHPVAEMTVKTIYRKETGKSYTILSQSGSEIIRSIVLGTILDNEKHINLPGIREGSWFTSANYEMKLKPGGIQRLDGRDCLALAITPRRKAPNHDRRNPVGGRQRRLDCPASREPHPKSFHLHRARADDAPVRKRERLCHGHSRPGRFQTAFSLASTVVTIDYRDYQIQLAPGQIGTASGCTPHANRSRFCAILSFVTTNPRRLETRCRAGLLPAAGAAPRLRLRPSGRHLRHHRRAAQLAQRPASGHDLCPRPRLHRGRSGHRRSGVAHGPARGAGPLDRAADRPHADRSGHRRGGRNPAQGRARPLPQPHREPPGHRHQRRAVAGLAGAPLLEPASPQPERFQWMYNGKSVFVIGILHGVGAETPSQLALFFLTANLGGTSRGMMGLAAFAVGLVAMNALMTASMGGAFTRQRPPPPLLPRHRLDRRRLQLASSASSSSSASPTACPRWGSEACLRRPDICRLARLSGMLIHPPGWVPDVSRLWGHGTARIHLPLSLRCILTANASRTDSIPANRRLSFSDLQLLSPAASSRDGNCA